MLPRRQLGNTGLEVTQLGYGTMGLRGPNTWGVRTVDDSRAEELLNAVLDAGINYIDTSPDYGVCEERIGRFIGSRRSEFILATKCGCTPVQHDDHLEVKHTWNRETIQRNIEESLKRLQTDVIDLMQFHGGDAETLQKEGLLELLSDYRDQGTIRYIGVSSSLPKLSGMIELGLFDAFQVAFSCLNPEHLDAMRLATAQGAGVIVRGGIAKGGPDAEIQRPELNSVWEQARLDDFLDSRMTKSELILRYTLTVPQCDTTIVGTCNLEHLRSNVAAAEAGNLPDDLFQGITARVATTLAQQ